MKYSEAFERDYNWYLSHRDIFSFDAKLPEQYVNKKGESLIWCSPDGRSAKECFYLFDSSGKTVPTSEPQLLMEIVRCKGSLNFNIKMWAESRADGTLPRILFQEIIHEYKLLPWMAEAVEKQKYKYYKIT